MIPIEHALEPSSLSVRLPSIMCLLSSSVVRSSARMTSSAEPQQTKKKPMRKLIRENCWYRLNDDINIPWFEHCVLYEVYAGTNIFVEPKPTLTGFAYPVYITVELTFQLLLSP